MALQVHLRMDKKLIQMSNHILNLNSSEISILKKIVEHKIDNLEKAMAGGFSIDLDELKVLDIIEEKILEVIQKRLENI